ncbi:MAG: hypothetical protein M1837_001162 [Sclerophora amabilis]|nr:MAG: hypothetical protein M1837_001162 [Sclerophora amabilis]
MSEDAPTIAQLQAGNEDADSGLGDIESSPTSDDDSVMSEAKDYIEENGRLYHADWTAGRYLLPNDEREQERLEIQHIILLYTDGLHRAPLPEGPQRVLDVGTGTGDWAIAFAETYTSAVVTAVDISPNVMPTETHPNCSFLVDDAENGIGLGNNEFDYIHIRLLHGLRDSRRFIALAFEALVPGGYIEIKEFEFPLQFHDPDKAKGSALMIWSTNVVEGALRLGIDLTIVDKIFGLLEDGGFEDIGESICVWPIGTWPKKRRRRMLGTSLQENWFETLAAFAWRPFCVMDWHKEETQCLLANARAEICGNKIRASMHVRTFWARKPYLD